MTTPTPATPLRLRPLIITLAMAALVLSNLATLLSANYHDRAFGVLRSLFALAGQEAAEMMTLRSKAGQAEQVESRSAKLLQMHKVKTMEVLEEERGLRAKAERELAELKGSQGAAQRESRHVAAARDQALKTAEAVRQRMAKAAARRLDTLAAESVPMAGVGVALSMRALELHENCETLRELNQLLAMLGHKPQDMGFCGTRMPGRDQVLAGLRTDWRRSAEAAAVAAKAVPSVPPVPELRAPLAGPERNAVCALVPLPGCPEGRSPGVAGLLDGDRPAAVAGLPRGTPVNALRNGSGE